MYYTKAVKSASLHTSTAFSKALPVVIFVVLMFLLFKFWTVIKNLFSSVTDDAKSKSDEQKVTKQYGLPHEYYKGLEIVAEQVHGFLHDSSFDEDEDGVKHALSVVKTPTQVKTLSAIYKLKYNLSLKLDIEKYFTYFDFAGFPDVVSKNYY